MPRHPDIARALGVVRPQLEKAGLAGARVMVACSGGRDSVAALALLDCLRGPLDLDLSVGHVDHGLRPESGSEAGAVGELAAQLGLPAYSRRLALEPGPNLAERARQARRLALEALARDADANAIVLGHTASDQAETVLMNLTRGTGLLGLCAMRASEPPYVRPLLGLRRSETAQLCGHFGLAYVDDPTNEAVDAARIRIRNEILPVLERQNPRAVEAIAGAALRLQEVERELDASTRRWYGSLRTESGLGLPPVGEAGPSETVLGRVVRLALSEQGVSEVPASTLAAMRSALDEHAWARAGRGPAGGARPRTFHLRPSKRVVIDRRGLLVSAHAEESGPNH